MARFKRLGAAIRRAFSRSPEHSREQSPRTTLKALDVFGRCPNCGKALQAHSYWRLASAVIDGSGDSDRKLAALIAERQWGAASRIAEWRYDRDIREYGVVRCPYGPRLGLVIAVFTYDLYANDCREDTRLLSEEDSQIIKGLAGDAWLVFEAEAPARR